MVISVLPSIVVGLLLSIWLLALLTPEVRVKHHESKPIKLWQILKQPEVLAFFVVYMLLQIAHGPYYVFYSIYLHDNGHSGVLIGLLWALGVGAEIVLFTGMRGLLQRFQIRHLLFVQYVSRGYPMAVDCLVRQ